LGMPDFGRMREAVTSEGFWGVAGKEEAMCTMDTETWLRGLGIEV